MPEEAPRGAISSVALPGVVEFSAPFGFPFPKKTCLLQSPTGLLDSMKALINFRRRAYLLLCGVVPFAKAAGHAEMRKKWDVSI